MQIATQVEWLQSSQQAAGSYIKLVNMSCQFFHASACDMRASTDEAAPENGQLCKASQARIS